MTIYFNNWKYLLQVKNDEWVNELINNVFKYDALRYSGYWLNDWHTCANKGTSGLRLILY